MAIDVIGRDHPSVPEAPRKLTVPDGRLGWIASGPTQMQNAADESCPAYPLRKPNALEIAILHTLARKEPSIHSHMGRLLVLSREFTGIGSFIADLPASR